MTKNIRHKTFESFNDKNERFKKEMEPILKYFSLSSSEWDTADILSEITDIVTDNDISVTELKMILDENRDKQYYKYLRKVYNAMLHDEEFGQKED